ncbi:MAG TPA: MFS transporter [Sporichthya sp.]|nr:MFS transporter [Sporichthya sp.]
MAATIVLPRTAGKAPQLQTAAPPAVDAAARAHARRWLVLAVLGVAQLMVVLDATIMNVALPSAQTALGFSDADRQWVVTAYALAFGSLLPLGGRLSDLLGRRTTFLFGLAGFAGASALGGAATNFEILVSARALQGVFGALLAPAALSLLTTTFSDPKERAKAFAVFGALAGTGGAIGLLLGGALTTYVSWRWALYVNVAFAAVAFAGAAALLPKLARNGKVSLDLKGTLAVSAGLFSLVYGFSNAETDGWHSGVTVGFLAASVVLLATFAVLQTRVAQPLLPPRVLLDRTRGGAYLAVLFTGAGMFAVFLFLTYYLQAIQGYSAIRTGVAFLPMVAALVAMAQIATIVLLRRVGARVLVTLGLAVSALGMSDFTVITAGGDYATQVLPGLLVLGMGIGLVFAPAMQAAVSGVEARDAGVASAMVNTMQQVGGSIGVALLGTVAADSFTSHLSAGAAAPQAMVESYVTAFWWASAIFAVGAVLVGALLNSGTLPQAAEGAEPVLAH